MAEQYKQPNLFNRLNNQSLDWRRPPNLRVIDNDLFRLKETPYLNLPKDILSNLHNGEPLQEPDGVYTSEFILLVMKYLVSGRPHLFGKNGGMKENIRQFTSMFLPSATISDRKIESLDDVLTYPHRKVMTIGELPPLPENKRRVFIHGRFNGPPPPSFIESLILLRQTLGINNISEKLGVEIIVGIDSDPKLKAGEAIFMNLAFRTSLLLTLGDLIDKVVIIDSPTAKHLAKLDTSTAVGNFWTDLYTEVLRPDYTKHPSVLVVDGDDPLAEEKAYDLYAGAGNMWCHYFQQIDGKQIFMHRSDIRAGRVTRKEIKEAWKRVKSLYRKIS